MKNLIIILPLALILCFMVGCQDKGAYVDRFMEDGVEVVMNLPVPQDELENPILTQILSIDTENDELVNYGLNDIWGFDVNSVGEIFIFNPPQSGVASILKFNGSGEFILAFGKKGGGPGEIQFPIYQRINPGDEVSVLDVERRKLLVFDGNGSVLQESTLVDILSSTILLLPLPNGNYLSRKIEVDESPVSFSFVYLLLDSKFEELAELGRATLVNPATSPIKPTPIFQIGLSNKHIFVGLEERGYDIHVYDFEGLLIRRIRKEYTSVPFSEERKELIKKKYKRFPWAEGKIVFPTHNPPFQHLFADDMGRLYVVTFEPGKNQGEFMTDVFDAEGVHCSRLSIKPFLNADIFWTNGPYDEWVSVKNNILYCIQEKESGHKELVAYEIKWH